MRVIGLLLLTAVLAGCGLSNSTAEQAVERVANMGLKIHGNTVPASAVEALGVRIDKKQAVDQGDGVQRFYVEGVATVRTTKSAAAASQSAHDATREAAKGSSV